jgi:DNA-directed RNA polymerase subunit RPC12/RpoP
MTQDSMIDCPNCGEKLACYVTAVNESKNSYSCFGCGMTTNDFMKQGEFDFQEYESALPELYKDLKTTDADGRVWYPQAINIQGKGTVFTNGTSKDDWQWSAIKSIPLTAADKKNPRFKGQTHKSDSASMTGFGKDFIEALDHIDFFNS